MSYAGVATALPVSVVMALCAAAGHAAPVSEYLFWERQRTVFAEHQWGDEPPQVHSETTPLTAIPRDPSLPFAEVVATEVTTRAIEATPVGGGIGGKAGAQAWFTPEDRSFIEIDAAVTTSFPEAPQRLRAVVTETYTATNFTGTPQRAEFSLTIDDIAFAFHDRLDIAAAGPDPFLGSSQAIGMRVWNELRLDGVRIGSWEAQVWGDARDLAWRADDLGAILGVLAVDRYAREFPEGDPAVPRVIHGYVPSLISVPLGIVPELSSMTIASEIGAELLLPPGLIDAGGRLTIGDPSRPGGGARFEAYSAGGGPTAPVPLPATGWLIAAGIGALVLRRFG